MKSTTAARKFSGIVPVTRRLLSYLHFNMFPDIVWYNEMDGTGWHGMGRPSHLVLSLPFPLIFFAQSSILLFWASFGLFLLGKFHSSLFNSRSIEFNFSLNYVAFRSHFSLCDTHAQTTSENSALHPFIQIP